jgi:hypothetical protein
MTLRSGHQRYPIRLGSAEAPKEIVFSPAVTGLDGSALSAKAFGIAFTAFMCYGAVMSIGSSDLFRSHGCSFDSVTLGGFF